MSLLLVVVHQPVKVPGDPFDEVALLVEYHDVVIQPEQGPGLERARLPRQRAVPQLRRQDGGRGGEQAEERLDAGTRDGHFRGRCHQVTRTGSAGPRIWRHAQYTRASTVMSSNPTPVASASMSAGGRRGVYRRSRLPQPIAANEQPLTPRC